MFGWFTGLTLLKKVLLIGGAMVAGSAISGVAPLPPEPSASLPQTAEETPQVQSDTVETKSITEEQVITFQSLTQNDPTLEKGKTLLAISGVNGVNTITYSVTYTNGVETNRQKVSELITKQPINQVTKVGTKVAPISPRCDSNYSGCVPIVSYDLDCPDIGFMVRVLGSDRHRFDRDGDGYGCESYQ